MRIRYTNLEKSTLTVFVALAVILFGQLECRAGGVEELGRLIAASFEAQERGSDLLIGEIMDWERTLDIPTVSAEDHVVIKYMLSHWKMWTGRYLLRRAPGGPTQFRFALSNLQKLNYTLDRDAILELHSLFLKLPQNERRSRLKEEYGQLLATRGDPKYTLDILKQLQLDTALGLFGPERLIKILPIDPSRWKSHGWVKVPGMDAYKWVEGGIEYRGLNIKEGDLLLVDLNKLYDGVNTSFSTPRSSFTHNAVVVFLEHKGRKIPAALEIHSAGLRVVPLNTYLSPDFTSYVEVFRLNDPALVPEHFHERLGALVSTLLREQMGYDFNARPIPVGGYDVMVKEGQRCVVCSSLVDVIYKTFGVSVKIPKSEIHPGERAHLRRVGLNDLADAGTYLTPTDLKLTKQHSRVGIIDNGFTRNILRELTLGAHDVPGSIGYLLSQHHLESEKIQPWQRMALYRSVLWIARNIREGSSLGKTLLTLSDFAVGLNERTRPQAPDEALATVVVLNHGIEASVKEMGRATPVDFPGATTLRKKGVLSWGGSRINCSGVFLALGAKSPFHIRAVENLEQVRKPVEESLMESGVLNWFH